MATPITVFVLAIVLTSTALGATENGCQRSDVCDNTSMNPVLKPNPDDCGSFCVCSCGGSALMNCPDGQEFDPINKQCDWPSKAHCTLKPDPPPPGNNGCEKQQYRCPAFENGHAVLLPNPDDCNSFCQCDWGNIHWMPCPPGLYFNPTNQVCDWPKNVDCVKTTKPPPTTTTTTTTTTQAPTVKPGSCEKVRPDCPEKNEGNATLLPNPDDCGSYCVCDWGEPTLMPCPNGLYFNPHRKVCDWKWRADCPPGSASAPPPPPPTEVNPPGPTSNPGSCEKVRPDCPEKNEENATLLPNPDDCGSYCVCDGGEPIWMPCPNGLYFNPHRKVCDWKWRADCPPGSASAPPPPPPTEVNPPGPTSNPGSCEKVRPDCPEKNEENATLLPNPDDCGSYCVCDGGEPIWMPCPDGLYFNPHLKVCDLKWRADCPPGSATVPPPPPTHNNVPTVPPVKPGSCEKVRPDCPEKNEENATLLPNPDDCGSYCVCDGGEPIWMPCPDGLYFNPHLKVCDLKWRADCPPGSATVPPPPPTHNHVPTVPPVKPGSCEKVRPDCPEKNKENATLLPNPDDCGSYCVCDWGEPTWMPCPKGLYFNPYLKVCDWPNNADCPPGSASVPPPPAPTGVPPQAGDCDEVSPKCPKNDVGNATLLPNPNDCHSYCACSWGRANWMPCPAGLHFNPFLSVCDWPKDANCGATTEIPPVPPHGKDGCFLIADKCPVPQLKGDYLLANPWDTRSFCQCNWGTIQYMPCAPGTNFNEKLQVCV